MTLYLIGLGLNLNSISCDAREKLNECDEIYLEGYTVDFPYELENLKESLNLDFEVLNRNNVENDFLIKKALNKKIALLVYGDVLSATTHSSLILDCKKNKIDYQIYHNASILLSISQTGLQLYKFGKISSMPKWEKSYEPDSFLDYILENQRINAHSLLLIDIGLKFDDALTQLEKSCNLKNFNLEKFIVISNSGTNKQKVYYETVESLRNINSINLPFCFIIPSKLHFLEEEFLNEVKENINP